MKSIVLILITLFLIGCEEKNSEFPPGFYVKEKEKSGDTKKTEYLKDFKVIQKGSELIPAKMDKRKAEEKLKEVKANLTSLLVDPESVRFRNIKIIDVSGFSIQFRVCGEINAKNGYGGYVGFRTFFYNYFSYESYGIYGSENMDSMRYRELYKQTCISDELDVVYSSEI